MRRVIMTLLFALGTIPMFGQRDINQIDIKEFDRVGRDAIVAMLGEPLQDKPTVNDPDLFLLNDPEMIYLKYPGLWIVLYQPYDAIEFVRATTPAVCFLSDYIPGGIKVGDSFEKLQSYDFANSVYGRGKPGNGLTFLDAGRYMAFQEEFMRFTFYIEGGIITKIVMSEAEDQPYENYDYSNKLW